ncbi:hypothetical protein CEQ28_009555 [Hafnia alvei]|nr:hypothetical protein CEQ28_009555 [Hafnia alvei]
MRWGLSSCLYPSYFKLYLCWLHLLTRITYLSKLIGIRSLAASMQLELFWVYPYYIKISTGDWMEVHLYFTVRRWVFLGAPPKK